MVCLHLRGEVGILPPVFTPEPPIWLPQTAPMAQSETSSLQGSSLWVLPWHEDSRNSRLSHQVHQEVRAQWKALNGEVGDVAGFAVPSCGLQEGWFVVVHQKWGRGALDISLPAPPALGAFSSVPLPP